MIAPIYQSSNAALEWHSLYRTQMYRTSYVDPENSRVYWQRDYPVGGINVELWVYELQITWYFN